MERDTQSNTPVKGRLGRAVARFDAVIFSVFDSRARQSAGLYEDLPSVRSREIRNKFKSSRKLGATADILIWAAQRAVARHERRVGA